jgi:Translationally controlled tumour protein
MFPRQQGVFNWFTRLLFRFGCACTSNIWLLHLVPGMVIIIVSVQEQPSYDKKAFMGYVKAWLQKVVSALPEEKQAEFKKKSEPGVKFLLKLLKDLQLYVPIQVVMLIVLGVLLCVGSLFS